LSWKIFFGPAKSRSILNGIKFNNDGGLRMKLRTVVAAALCIGLACGIMGAQAYAQGAKVTVYNPMGTPPPIQMRAMAPRLDTIDGKTIYLINTGFPNSGPFMQVMSEWFRDNHPSVKVEIRGSQGMENISQAVRDDIVANADAVLFGLGH